MIINATILRGKLERLDRTLSKTIEYFGSSRDETAQGSFIGSIDDLDDIVHTCLYLGEYGFIRDLLPVIRELDSSVQNDDIPAITDTLEYKLLPYIKTTIEGMDEV